MSANSGNVVFKKTFKVVPGAKLDKIYHADQSDSAIKGAYQALIQDANTQKIIGELPTFGHAFSDSKSEKLWLWYPGKDDSVQSVPQNCHKGCTLVLRRDSQSSDYGFIIERKSSIDYFASIQRGVLVTTKSELIGLGDFDFPLYYKANTSFDLEKELNCEVQYCKAKLSNKNIFLASKYGVLDDNRLRLYEYGTLKYTLSDPQMEIIKEDENYKCEFTGNINGRRHAIPFSLDEVNVDRSLLKQFELESQIQKISQAAEVISVDAVAHKISSDRVYSDSLAKAILENSSQDQNLQAEIAHYFSQLVKREDDLQRLVKGEKGPVGPQGPVGPSGRDGSAGATARQVADTLVGPKASDLGRAVLSATDSSRKKLSDHLAANSDLQTGVKNLLKGDTIFKAAVKGDRGPAGVNGISPTEEQIARTLMRTEEFIERVLNTEVAYLRDSTDTRKILADKVTEKLKVDTTFKAAVKGDRGPTGLQGPQGVQGLPGTPGVTGIRGAQGHRGNDADPVQVANQLVIGSSLNVLSTEVAKKSELQMGVKDLLKGDITFKAAVKGDRGPTGPQGSQGMQGLPGPAGSTGPRGEKGIQGDQGDQGPPGIQGLPGQKGATGSRGPAGSKGQDGLQGKQGPEGSQGIQGIQGFSGPAGPTGPRGARGEEGTPGPAGPQGNDGQDGKDADPSEIAHRLAHNFSLKRSLKGEDGEPGRDGEKGEQGQPGIEGLPGLDGRDGRDADPAEVAKKLISNQTDELVNIIRQEVVGRVTTWEASKRLVDNLTYDDVLRIVEGKADTGRHKLFERLLNNAGLQDPSKAKTFIGNNVVGNADLQNAVADALRSDPGNARGPRGERGEEGTQGIPGMQGPAGQDADLSEIMNRLAHNSRLKRPLKGDDILSEQALDPRSDRSTEFQQKLQLKITQGESYDQDKNEANIELEMEGKSVIIATFLEIGYFFKNDDLYIRNHITGKNILIPKNFHFLKVVEDGLDNYKLAFCNNLGNLFFDHKKYDPEYADVPEEHKLIDLKYIKNAANIDLSKYYYHTHTPLFAVKQGELEGHSLEDYRADVYEIGKDKKIGTLVDEFGFFENGKFHHIDYHHGSDEHSEELDVRIEDYEGNFQIGDNTIHPITLYDGHLDLIDYLGYSVNL